MRKIDSIFLHYSDSSDVSLSAINYWHLLAFPGNPDPYTGLFISYHHVIHQNGQVEAGRDERSVGWHVKGYNLNSIGIVLTGSDGMDWYPTDKQYASLDLMLIQLMTKYSIPQSEIYFHRDKNATSCPGRLDKNKILRMLNETKTTPIEEEEMKTVIYQSGEPLKNHFIEGIESEDAIIMYLRAQEQAPKTPNIVNVYVYPSDLEKGVVSFRRILENNRPERINLTKELNERSISGRVGIRITAKPRFGIRRPFTAALVLENE